jgi:hypothetical protein
VSVSPVHGGTERNENTLQRKTGEYASPPDMREVPAPVLWRKALSVLLSRDEIPLNSRVFA